ncbi:MAG: hypothetical protein Q9171_003606 [Xanthocarpia ochracea]
MSSSKKRCGIDNCPSTRYEFHDGLLYCGEGHQQEQGPQTQTDEDPFVRQGRKSRTKRETQEKVSKVYRGSEAFKVFLISYQHILQKQCYILIHTFGLPAKLEEVVRNELWAPRLQLLTARLGTSDDDAPVFSSQATSDGERNTNKGGQAGRRERESRIRWAYREDIPYVRAVRHIPRETRERLPPLYLNALDTTSILRADDLRKTVHELSLFYSQKFKMNFPVLNHPLVLFRHVRSLALPLDVYPAVRRITKLLDINFAFPASRSRQKISSFPEVALIALLVITVKLYYPFDTIDRHTRSAADPGTLALDWDQWCKAQKEYDSRETANGQLGRGNEIKVEEKDVFSLSDYQMDEYLDWFEKTWVDEERARSHPRGHPEQLLDMFPTGRRRKTPPPHSNAQQEYQANDEALERKLRTVQEHLKVREIVSDRDARRSRRPINRIGSYYKRYRKVDDLPNAARTFHETAAKLVAITLPSLLVAVRQVEQKLIKWRERDLEAKAAVDEVGESRQENEGDDVSDKASVVDEPSMDVDEISSEDDANVNQARVMESVESSDSSESLDSSDESS